MEILVYSFRTFPFIEQLKAIFGEVFIFGSLKKDIKNLENNILEKKPALILGIALSKEHSRFETSTINKFNKKNIIVGGRESYDLYVPSEVFLASKQPTNSFCNWSMYKLAQFIDENNINTRLSFIHLAKSDIDKLESLK